MTEDDLPIPAAAAARRAPMRVALIVAALAAGATAVVLARQYRRPEPVPPLPAPGMTVGSASVTLAPGAPMWKVLVMAPAAPAEPHWSDPIPARVTYDETRASRLGSPLAGRVTAVMVERGERVKAGAPVFAVSSPSFAELRAELEKATVVQASARAGFERVKSLVDVGALPAKELVTARQELAEADLAVKLARQKRSSLRIGGGGDASFTVTAPRDGVVVEKNLAVGQEVDAASGAVIAIADLSSVWVVADLFGDDVGTLAVGAPARVKVGAVELEGTIDHISAIVDPERRTVPVRVRLPNADGALRPNALAQLRFFDPSPARVALPASAVLSDGARSYIYVERGAGELVRRDITVGAVSGGVVPVLAGVEPGERVVVQGAVLLDNQLQLDG